MAKSEGMGEQKEKITEKHFCSVLINTASFYKVVDMSSLTKECKQDKFHWALSVGCLFWKKHTAGTDPNVIHKLARQFDTKYGDTELGQKLARLDKDYSIPGKAQYEFMAPVWSCHFQPYPFTIDDHGVLIQKE